MKLIRTEYAVENNLPVIYLFTHDENNQPLLVKDSSFMPYFYVSYNDFPVIGQTYKSIYGEDVVKINVNLPSDVSKVRDEYGKHYEADILFPQRYLIDAVHSIEQCDLRVLYIDIETDNSGRVPDATLALEPIICITTHINNCYTTFIFRPDFQTNTICRTFFGEPHIIRYYSNEYSLLNSFIDHINTEIPDVLTGWNCNGFDLPYIINRMKRLKIDFNRMSPMKKVYIRNANKTDFLSTPQPVIKGISVVDLMASYKIITGWTEGLKESYSLDSTGMEVLGYGKIGSAESINYDWMNKPDKLITYNAQDVRICVEIDRKRQIISFIDEIRRVCFCQFEDALTVSRMADSYILKMFHGRKVFPSKKHDQDVPEYEGALVECKGGGLYENVGVYDVSSLYPNIIYTANLSPETMRDGPEPGAVQIGKYYVRQDIDGYLPETIDHLKKERSVYKELRSQSEYGSQDYIVYNARQEVYKRLLNGIYGQTAFPGSRLYDPRVAETITWMGRELISWTRDYLKKHGYEVIYIDTDSVHVVFEEYDIDHMNRVLDLINGSYDEFVAQYGLTKHSFSMEFEKVYKKVFYGKDVKKRYAGHIVWKDGREADILNIYGFETKRSDSSHITKKVMMEVFDMVLRQSMDEDVVVSYINSEIDNIRNGVYSPVDIGTPKGITKSPYSYFRNDYNDKLPSWEQKGLTANIRGILYSKEVLGNQLSFKPKMIYIKKMPPGFPYIDVLCFDEEKHIPAGVEIDIEKMIEKIIVGKMKNIFSGLKWNIKKLMSGKGSIKSSAGEQLPLI